MKKPIAILLSAMLGLGCLLCGCGTETTESTGATTTAAPMTQPTLEEQTTDTSTEQPADTGTEQTAAPAATEDIQISRQGEAVQTDYYTITLPAMWANECSTDTWHHEEDTGYGLHVYHTASMNADMGGDLFTIDLYPEGTDYTFLPAYDYLGRLTTPTGVFSVVVLYPTDVRFSEQTASSYRALEKDIPTVLDTLTAADGCTFEAA